MEIITKAPTKWNPKDKMIWEKVCKSALVPSVKPYYYMRDYYKYMAYKRFDDELPPNGTEIKVKTTPEGPPKYTGYVFNGLIYDKDYVPADAIPYCLDHKTSFIINADRLKPIIDHKDAEKHKPTHTAECGDMIIYCDVKFELTPGQRLWIARVRTEPNDNIGPLFLTKLFDHITDKKEIAKQIGAPFVQDEPTLHLLGEASVGKSNTYILTYYPISLACANLAIEEADYFCVENMIICRYLVKRDQAELIDSFIINKIMKDFKLNEKVKRGDVIKIDNKQGELGEFMAVWDGKSADIHIDELSEEKTIPLTLSFPEFPLDYWKDSFGGRINIDLVAVESRVEKQIGESHEITIKHGDISFTFTCSYTLAEELYASIKPSGHGYKHI